MARRRRKTYLLARQELDVDGRGGDAARFDGRIFGLVCVLEVIDLECEEEEGEGESEIKSEADAVQVSGRWQDAALVDVVGREEDGL